MPVDEFSPPKLDDSRASLLRAQLEWPYRRRVRSRRELVDSWLMMLGSVVLLAVLWGGVVVAVMALT